MAAEDLLSVGVYHACALRTDGTLACWGRNGSGQALGRPPARPLSPRGRR
ncbi:MAG: RCC1-like domain-containing protein [Methylococcales bacterium]